MTRNSINSTKCPLSAAFSPEREATHDLRPSLRAWAGIWTLHSADAVQAPDDLAIVIVHLRGASLKAQINAGTGVMQPLEPGACIAMGAGVPFRLRLEGECRILGLVFDEALIRMSAMPIMARAPGHYALRPGTIPPPNAIGKLAELLAAELDPETEVRTACRAALMLSIIEFVAANRTLSRRGEAASPVVEDCIQRVLRLIDDNISLELPLDWLANEARLSPYHLSRSFRKVMGVGLAEYTRTRRMHAACRLLAETRKPLAEIAYDCGFSSQSRMNSVFRSGMDMTPLEYRKSCWKLDERAITRPAK